MNILGKELIHDPELSLFEKIYVCVFGAPISGLRIRLRRVLPELSGNFKKIGDLGCGRGIFSFELAKKYPEASVVGIDIADSQIRKNQHIADHLKLKNLTFKTADLLNFNSNESFDLILSIDNLEHVVDDLTAAKNLFASLAPGGYLACHVPADRRRWYFSKIIPNFDVPGHVRVGYSLAQITSLLETAGFVIIRAKHTFGPLETFSNNISYLITGADQRRKLLYALIFPMLNFLALLGRHQSPGNVGAGVFVLAQRPTLN